MIIVTPNMIFSDIHRRDRSIEEDYYLHTMRYIQEVKKRGNPASVCIRKLFLREGFYRQEVIRMDGVWEIEIAIQDIHEYDKIEVGPLVLNPKYLKHDNIQTDLTQ